MIIFKNNSGFSLIETMVTILVFVAVMGVLTGFIVFSYQSYGYAFQQVRAIREAQKGVETMIEEIREARSGEDGAYFIEGTENYEFIFYSDIDKDLETERVRYYIDDNKLIKEVINSQGFPPQYSSQPSSVVLSDCVRNSYPIFRYFDEFGEELAAPARKKDTKMMQIYLEINVNPNRVPSAFVLETGVNLRNSQ